MDQDRRTAFLKGLVCPRCRKRYSRDDVAPPRGDGGENSLDVRCARCQLRVRLPLPRSRRAQVQRRKKAAASGNTRPHRAPVTDNDVLQMHLLLASFGGSFERLLEQI